jgi:hypothetical protein
MRLNRFVRIGAVSLVVLTTLIVAVARAGDAAKARRSLASAKDYAQSERWDNFDGAMKKAEADMEGLSDTEKAPLLEEVKAIKAIVTKSVEDDVNKRLAKITDDPGTKKFAIDRATLRLNSDEAKNYADAAAIEKLRKRVAEAGGDAAPAKPAETSPTPAKPSTGAKAELTGDLKTASVRIEQAKNFLKQNDPGFAARSLDQARGLLKDIPEAQKAPLLADIASISKQIDDYELKAQLDEEHRRVDEQVSRYVGTAENSIERGVVCDSEWIDKSTALLATHDAKTYLSDEERKKYQDRVDATRASLKEHNKTVSIERSADILKELEDKVATDPFKGLDERAAHDMYVDIKSLADRVKGEFTRVPQDQPEIKAVLDRVAKAQAKAEAASGKWAIEKMQEQFVESWKVDSKHFEGWEAEKPLPEAAKERRVDGLYKTTQAVRGSAYWLNDRETKETIEKYKDDPIVKATAKEAQDTLEAAALKLSKAFNDVLAMAEAAPMPQKESDRFAALVLAGDAEQWFAGTKHQGPNVARAKALDEKWKAEVARIEKERAATLKRMTDEATAAWAKIEPSLTFERGFDPADAERYKGKTIRIKGYYNRTGWDFDAMYHFACDVKGKPVAGNYAPHVLAAFNDVQDKSHFGIDDHTGWDVIAIVEGEGKINRRVTTEFRDKDTREVLFKAESHVAEPCVLIKVIGLHTGPLAVGPK